MFICFPLTLSYTYTYKHHFLSLRLFPSRCIPFLFPCLSLASFHFPLFFSPLHHYPSSLSFYYIFTFQSFLIMFSLSLLFSRLSSPPYHLFHLPVLFSPYILSSSHLHIHISFSFSPDPLWTIFHLTTFIPSFSSSLPFTCQSPNNSRSSFLPIPLFTTFSSSLSHRLLSFHSHFSFLLLLLHHLNGRLVFVRTGRERQQAGALTVYLGRQGTRQAVAWDGCGARVRKDTKQGMYGCGNKTRINKQIIGYGEDREEDGRHIMTYDYILLLKV